MQRRRGAHPHIEQSMHASSWTTRELRDLPGYSAKIDQCTLLVAKRRGGETLGYLRKAALILTTK